MIAKTQVLDDPTGNSFVENFLAPAADPAMLVTHYRRSRQQNQLIGLVADDDEDGEEGDENENEKQQTIRVNGKDVHEKEVSNGKIGENSSSSSSHATAAGANGKVNGISCTNGDAGDRSSSSTAGSRSMDQHETEQWIRVDGGAGSDVVLHGKKESESAHRMLISSTSSSSKEQHPADHQQQRNQDQADDADDENPLHVDPNELIKGESLEFVTNCNNCSTPCITRMKVTGM